MPSNDHIHLAHGGNIVVQPTLQRARPHLLAALGVALLSAACDLVKSATATMVVAASITATPELQVAGQLDVPGEVASIVYVGERASATSSEKPRPITGAQVSVTFVGKSVDLKEKRDEQGVYGADSVETPALAYQDGQLYDFGAATADQTYGGSVMAPNRLSPTSVTLTPAPAGANPLFPDLKVHPKDTQLKLEWASDAGRYAYVTVLRADKDNPNMPAVVFDNRPDSAEEIIDLIAKAPPTSIVIPAATFAEDGIYAVVLVAMNKGEPKSNTLLVSPILAGSGAAVLLVVGNPG